MRVNWRYIPSAQNTYAVLRAACGVSGFSLNRVNGPASDVTCYSLNSFSAKKFRHEIASSECITVAGGPHATACYPDLVRICNYVVVGEGEFTLPLLLTHLEAGKPGSPRGVATAEGYTPADNSVVPGAYPPFGEVQGFIEISRGCPFSCTYCQTPMIFGHCMRHRPIDQIQRYAAKLKDARFVTPNAFAYGSDGREPRLDRVGRLLSGIKSRIYFGTFPSEVRPEFISDEALELVTTYCTNTTIHFGAQSGSDRVLGALRRGHTVADTICAVERCRSHGLDPVVDIIVGIPGETDDEQNDTIGLIKWVTGYGSVHVHRFMPLPGTALAGTSTRGLLDETRRVLGRLALKGKLTGTWGSTADSVFYPSFE